MWLQNYNPLHSAFLSTAASALPIVILLGAIAFLKLRIHVSALLGLLAAVLLALFVYQMPAISVGAATVYGAAFGLFPVGWIVLNVMFLYELTVRKGLFDVLRQSVASLAPDPRIQVILIAFSFGAFIEGVAGFGTPVAITGAILIQLGFKPLHASGLALIANTAPVAFGSLGIPLTTLEQVTGVSAFKLSAMVGRQLPFFSLLIPFWVVIAYCGFRRMLPVWPAALTAGLAFAIPQFVISNFHGPWLVDVISGASSMLALVLLLRFWKPGVNQSAAAILKGEGDLEYAEAGARTFLSAAMSSSQSPPQHGHEPSGIGACLEARPDLSNSPRATAATREPTRPARRKVFQAWLPWLLLTGFILAWGLPKFKAMLDRSTIKFAVPHLHNVVQRAPPVGSNTEKAEFNLNLLSATGTGILLAGITAGFCIGYKPGELMHVWLQTLWKVRWSLLTIAAMLALGNVTKFSGADATLGLALSRTGVLYPFFGTLLGWLGVALTGSDTASNVLFGSLQTITARQIGISPVLMASANSSGGVMGKMIDAQSIVVASTATQFYGEEGKILRFVFIHSIMLAVLVGILVLLQAYLHPLNAMVVH